MTAKVARRDCEDNESDGDHLKVPKWFLYIASAAFTIFNVLFIPWAVWVTSMLITIDARTDVLQPLVIKLDNLSDRVSKIEGSLAVRKKDSVLEIPFVSSGKTSG